MSRTLPFGLAFLAVLTAATVAITQPAIGRVQKGVNTTSMLLAKLTSSLMLSVLSEEEVAKTMKEVITAVDFPMVITDHEDKPRAWRQIGVDPNKFTPEQLARPGEILEDPDYQKILRARDRLRAQNKPFPISGGGRSVVGYVYFGQPASLAYLRLLQVVLPLLGLFTFLGLLWAARSLYAYRLSGFWASFAKGLAHQMGTPVSSSWGWLELLKREARVDPEILEGLEGDLERMRSILRRFSKIGGPPQLERVLLSDIARNAVDEARARFMKNMDVEVISQGECPVLGDPELLSWVFEIFLKNAHEAKRDRGARMIVRVAGTGRFCVVEMEDNGRGIPRQKHRLLFKRSFTTKERGWGVGLLLARRIVEDIHRGKLRLKESVPGERTVFEMRLRTLGEHP